MKPEGPPEAAALWRTPEERGQAAPAPAPGDRSRSGLRPVDSARVPAPGDRSRSGLRPVDSARARSPEFPPGADELDELSRRSFLKFLGASAAGVALSSCLRSPNEKILPYSRAWPDTAPGRLLHYASVLGRGGHATGVLVTSYDGRPIKIEGNPDHPASLGATTAIDQAELNQLYDPARKSLFLQQGAAQSWPTFQRWMLARATSLEADGGARLRLLLEPSPSPLLAELRARILGAFPRARIFSYCAAAPSSNLDGVRLATGARLEPSYDLSKAEVIVLLDSDLLAQGPDCLRHARAFASHRAPPHMNRLYVAEPSLSPTGSLADHRLRLKTCEIGALALAIAGELSRRPEGRALSPLQPLAAGVQLPAKALRFARVAAADLATHPGASLVVAGEHQSAAVHALALAMNQALGNRGKVLRLFPEQQLAAEAGLVALRALVQEMRAGAVDTLLVTAFNPAYASPADLGFAGALERVAHPVYLGAYQDETAALSEWSLPRAHALETWGDARTLDGMASIAQPLIAPLFNGIAESELLASLLGEGDRGAHKLLTESWARRGGPVGPAFEKWLADGVLPEPNRSAEGRSSSGPLVRGPEPAAPSNARVDFAAVVQAARALPLAARPGIELHLPADRKLYDGRYANNAWLLELPEPTTKLTWDNAALVSVATARKLALEQGEIVQLRARAGTLLAPVLIAPGQADDCVSVALGWGQRGEGLTVGQGVGANAFLLQHSGNPYFQEGLEVEKTGRSTQLALTQEHWKLEGRPIAFALDARDLEKAQTRIAAQRGELPKLYEPFTYREGHAWGMAIDLSRCTGCSACMVACQAENNIPAVGKAMILRGREMYWLRVDRYFTGEPDDPETLNEPMACVHCEYAPCEYVCPVNATVHSDEGLNEMVYNRCIGTRYCSNNCPYKVRRFNFFNWNKDLSKSEQMAKNPDVTVRSRGVMEKCSYCVQRIERARIDSRIAGGAIKDGRVITACQQACPTEAIAFGDLNDPDSKVVQLKRDARSFEVLHDLGTRPRTSHLARLTNKNPALD
jgi:molybdopterin-containing oxidoreductase family iron-sulfur binding subunit